MTYQDDLDRMEIKDLRLCMKRLIAQIPVILIDYYLATEISNCESCLKFWGERTDKKLETVVHTERIDEDDGA